MTDTRMQPNQVPLVEQLRSVPANAHLAVNTPNPLGHDTQHFAIGAMCHKAAARLDALRAELEAAKRDAERYRWLVGSHYRRIPADVAQAAQLSVLVLGDPQEIDAAIDAARKERT